MRIEANEFGGELFFPLETVRTHTGRNNIGVKFVPIKMKNKILNPSISSSTRRTNEMSIFVKYTRILQGAAPWICCEPESPFVPELW